MEDRMMRECMRKLALWHTRTFKPIMTHDELDSIMVTKGFLALPPSSAAGNASLTFKEYVYYAHNAKTSSSPPPPSSHPRIRLPYPRIDGLHIYTYRAFLDAINFYLDMNDISDLFHIRYTLLSLSLFSCSSLLLNANILVVALPFLVGMPLHRIHDRSSKWLSIEGDDNIFVYRDGTLDQTTQNFYKSDDQSSDEHDSIIIRDKGNKTSDSCIVALKDIIVI
ncbi:hypothetical protein EZV62_012052 [Acer yangbiense]|uniref:Uncharacterized protein n=1 Tax=Acer yangbiense TaxID=1000413 RepID=A0A5C7I7M5_9ROSI|nr:hypothetical protein EZV62_012052 [Acer yangbiense]